MNMNPLRLKRVGKSDKPRCAAWSRKSVRDMVTFHKRRARHAAEPCLKTGHRRDLARLESRITNWDLN